MPYALFCHEAKLSKAFPTEADVWKQARQSGLLVDVASGDDKATPRPVLENDYEIRPCTPDPLEDPAENQAEAEWRAETDFLPLCAGGGSDQVVLTNPSMESGAKTGWKHGRHRRQI